MPRLDFTWRMIALGVFITACFCVGGVALYGWGIGIVGGIVGGIFATLAMAELQADRHQS